MIPSANGVNQFVVDRVFAILVTTGDKAPYEPGWTGSWGIVTPSNQPGVGGSIGLAPVQSVMSIPENAILCANPQEGILMLEKIKAEVEPKMSEKSGLQACVVHTEAVFDPQQGRLLPNLMLFPVGFMAYGDMVKVPEQDEQTTKQTIPGRFDVVEGNAEPPSEATKEEADTPATPNEENVTEGASRAPVEGTPVEGSPADNPTPATASMKVVAPEPEKA